jgi:hypothetical protein
MGQSVARARSGGLRIKSCMSRVSVVMLVFLVARPVRAHQPTISDGTATTPEAAIAFNGIQLSRVVYHEMTDEAQQLWLTFDIDTPQSLFITLGLPRIDRLEAYRPAFAVLGPGLPDIDLPFVYPEGVGGLIFLTGDVREPEVFHEPFSGTTSWILREEDVELPQAGTYYIVVYVPSGESGKLWIAPGEQEEFTLGDFIELGGILGQVRAFHEVAPGGFPCFLFPVAAIAGAFPMLRLLRRRSSPARRPAEAAH